MLKEGEWNARRQVTRSQKNGCAEKVNNGLSSLSEGTIIERVPGGGVT